MFDVKQAIANIPPDPDWEKFQEEQVAKLKTFDPTDANGQFGRRQVEMGLKRLADLTDQSEIDFELTRIAEGYALSGDYDNAIAITKSDAKLQEYRDIVDAIENPKACDCPQTKKFLKEIVLHKGSKVPLTYCTVCRSYSS